MTDATRGPRARGTVVVVGSINVDLLLRVDRLPQIGETIAGGTFEHHGGGKGTNQAMSAARAGAEVRFVGAVGDDDLGEQALAELAEARIDVSGVIRLPDTPTGVAVVVVDAAGDNQVAVASGAPSSTRSRCKRRQCGRTCAQTGCVCSTLRSPMRRSSRPRMCPRRGDARDCAQPRARAGAGPGGVESA